MRVAFDRSDWLAAMRLAERVAIPSNPPTSLSCVTLRTLDAHHVELHAADGGELGLRAVVSARVSSRGETALLAHHAAEVVRHAPEWGDVCLRADGDVAEFSSGPWRTGLHTYTPVRAENPAALLDPLPSVPARSLQTALAGMAAHTGDGLSTTYAMTGVLLRADGEALTAVASNNRVMLRRSVPCPVTLPPLLLPGRAVRLLSDHLQSCADVSWGLCGGTLFVQAGQLWLRIRLIAQRYPDSALALAAEEAARWVQVSADRMHTVLERVRALGGDDDLQVRLEHVKRGLMVSAATTSGPTQGGLVCDLLPAVGAPSPRVVRVGARDLTSASSGMVGRIHLATVGDAVLVLNSDAADGARAFLAMGAG